MNADHKAVIKGIIKNTKLLSLMFEHFIYPFLIISHYYILFLLTYYPYHSIITPQQTKPYKNKYTLPVLYFPFYNV